MAATRALVDAVSNVSADWLVRTSWQAGVLIAGVLAIQLLLGHKRLPPKWAYALWMLVVIRLLMPAAPKSSWSVFNLLAVHDIPAVTTDPATESTPDGDAATQLLPNGARITVGIIDGPERRVTSTTTVSSRSEPDAKVASRPTVTAFDWKLPIALAWLVGCAVVVVRGVWGGAALRRGIRKAASADAATLSLLARCGRELGRGKRALPRVLVTDAVSGPALFGFVRPLLLLPPNLLADLSREELRFVLLHELAHLRRRDPLANALLVLAAALHWFNPLARFALARCRAERELACDELVMRCVDVDVDVDVDHPPATIAPGSAYGQAVLRVAQALRPSARRVPVAAVGMIHTRSQLRRRIAMIATYTPPAVGRRSSRLPRVALPMLLVLLVASCALTDGATKPATKPSTNSDPARAAAAAAATEAGPADREQRETADRKTSDGEKTTQAALDRNLSEINVDGVPLADVIEYLREQTGQNILVDWRAMEAAGIDRNAPVTARVRNVSAAKALRIILDHVGGDTVNLSYAIDGNIVNVSTADALAKDTVTRVYDIRDIIIEIPDYTVAPTWSFPQTRPDPAKQRAERINEVTDLIKETVDPDSWRENGGSVGALREIQGQLIITQTQENQRQVLVLLEQLRETRAVQVTVEARFLTLDPAALDESLRQKLVPTFEGKGKAGVSFLTDDDVKAVLRASQQQEQSTSITAPRLTLFNGQRAYVMVGTDRAYVSGFSPAKQADGKTKWEPQNSIAHAGVTLDVAATCSADRKYVTLTLRPEMSRLVGMSTKPFAGPEHAPKDLMVEVPQITAQRLQTTASVPDRHTLLLGGLVADVDATGQPTTRPSGNLYMLVKPTLIIQREIEAKAEAKAKP